MQRASTTLLSAAATLAALAGLVVIPGGPAASATACVAWAALPSRVSLAGRQVTVRATLHATGACRGVTADNGGTANLNGPGPSTSDFPLQWQHIGDSDTAPFHASLDALGTYRISRGELQTYDASYRHIPFEWRTTATVVKYAGRFRNVAVRAGTLTARLLYYAKYGWAAHRGVRVRLERHTAGGWCTVARHRTSAGGRVSFAVGSGAYRLVSATTRSVWSATAGTGSVRV
jgi:hypothetical protein